MYGWYVYMVMESVNALWYIKVIIGVLYSYYSSVPRNVRRRYGYRSGVGQSVQ